jgi:hypothetical protein
VSNPVAHDLVVTRARLVVTMDDDRRRLAGGRVVVRDGVPQVTGLDEVLRRHRAVAAEWLAAVR